ncbi:peptidoglycan/LPS O-acetylase OafA/YrhL [Prauserella sediminis]|uniref:Peptidoglycan/LPS O-acetylase OafA/YrhL n=1 Tax=Prauserella sediminis TaxID=577680 RepID=A0A839XRM4_9PSEU|nr:acyltransferase [Prauserella sediminis]MBB3665367.1 peptidoglycan/LPS O-acetylase OafA/YrhL [Prauserella sediminis]
MTSAAPDRGATTNRRMSWDVIRVVAITFVVAGHVTGGAALIPDIEAYPVSLRLPFGTFTLLVLSGYFMGPTVRKLSAGRWLQSRLARILPAYVVAMLVTFLVLRIVAPIFNGEEEGPWYLPGAGDLVRNLLLVHEWTGNMHRRIDASYWTLPVQVAAFGAAAALCWYWRRHGAHRFRPAVAVWGVIAVSAVSPVLSGIARVVPTATGLYFAHLFAAGAAIWLWSQRRLAGPNLAAMLAAVLGLQLFRSSEPQWLIVTCLGVMLGLMCLAARGPDWDRVLGLLRRPISWLAGISFGIYLVHQKLGYVVARVLTGMEIEPWWLRMGLVLTAIVLAAWALTVLVERPLYRLLGPSKRRQAETRPDVGTGRAGRDVATAADAGEGSGPGEAAVPTRG